MRSTKEKNICGNCRYFLRHYVWDGGKSQYFALPYGHCISPRAKFRDYDVRACQHFKAAPARNDSKII